MKKQICIILLTSFAWTDCFAAAAAKKEVDICIYGGTSAGIVAAMAAKRMGKSVLLIEPSKHIGGMTTGGLGATDIGNKYAVTGLARMFYRELGKHYNKFEQWMFPPSIAMNVMQHFISDNDVNVLCQYRIIEADNTNGAIQSIVLEAADNTSELIRVKAMQYIDCTYEGDLMAKAGVSYFVGRESNDTYGESLNGVQLSYWHQFPDGVDPYIVPGDSTSGLCWGVSTNTCNPIGSGDSLIQAYNFRLCLTNDPTNKVSFTRPIDYDSTMYELLARAIPGIGCDINKYLLINWGEMPDDKYDVNNRGPLSTDMIGMNHKYPEATYEERQQIWKDHESYTKGLMYFMTHDARVPKEMRDKVNEFGWTKDEFIDNDNFPTQLYIREARRMIGEYVMTQKNCEGVEVVHDGVGLAAYIMDSHNCQRIIIDGMVKNEGDVQIGGFPPYPIAYRSITPKREECTNLLVPVCVSSSHIAYGSLRMEPVFMVLGQSAAVAAAIAIDKANNVVQDIDVVALQDKLASDPYLDGSIPDILVDDMDSNTLRRGNWQTHEGYYYKHSYAQGDLNTSNNEFIFCPDVKHASNYSIYFYCSSLIEPVNMPNRMAVRVKTADGTKSISVNPKQHIGQWVDLGCHKLNSGKAEIIIDGENSDGPIFADAIILKAE